MIEILRGLLISVSVGTGSWISYNVLRYERFSALPGGRVTGTFCAIASVVCAVWAIRHVKARWSIRALATLPLIGLTVRFYLPSKVGFRLSPQATQSQALLRVIASAQEEFRIKSGRYASSLDDLTLVSDKAGYQTDVALSSAGDKWWHGRIRYQGGYCEIHVGYPEPLQNSANLVEGMPVCGEKPRRGAYQDVAGAKFVGQPSPSNGSIDTSGNWPQHRANSRRTGIVDRAGPAYRWDAWVSGELRASASVAGDQVFVGAHGNGEVAALNLTTGALLWRARAPNWIHHEPIVDGRFVAYGFGNNEVTPPSGFDVRDRRSGMLLWRRFTPTSAMGAPLIEKGTLIGADLSGTVYAWNLVSGAELWKYSIPRVNQAGITMPMANPLSFDSVVAVSMEKTGLCFLSLYSGKPVRCLKFSGNFWGGGHSSPAFTGQSVVFTGKNNTVAFKWWERIFGFQFPDPSRQLANQVSVLSVEPTSGRVIWEVQLVGRPQVVRGHVAGTPVISGPLTLVPLPSIGEVVSISTSTGQVLWRSPAHPARGSVSVFEGRVFVATSKSSWVVLDLSSGKQLCSAPLPGEVDRAGLTISGATGIMTFLCGRVTAAPVKEWFSCSVRWPEFL